MVVDYSEFFVERRSDERRKQFQLLPPYLTEEGFVLVDRRDLARAHQGEMDLLDSVEASSNAL